MPSLKWRHNRERLLVRVAVLPPITNSNSSTMLFTEGLLDTGATGTAIRVDLANKLKLLPRGQRRVGTANADLMASEYLFRVGFIFGDYLEPHFNADQQQPYVLEDDILGFELKQGFPHSLLIGMDILSLGNLSIGRNGIAQFTL